MTVGLKNDTEQMIRLTNLHEQKSLQLLDTDGFAVFSIISVENLSDKNIGESENKIEYKITLGLKNNTDKPIRMTNLQERDSLQLLDKNGFAVFSSGPFGNINIPGKAAVKSTFRFPVDGNPSIIKIYESEIKINEEVIK